MILTRAVNLSGKCVLSYFVALLLYASCGESVVDPEVRVVGVQIDTLVFLDAATMMRVMYHISNDNIFLVGHCSIMDGTMWHYNGAGWAAIRLRSSGGNISDFFTLYDIDGIAGDIYSVGRNWSSTGAILIRRKNNIWFDVSAANMPILQSGMAYNGRLLCGSFHGSLYSVADYEYRQIVTPFTHDINDQSQSTFFNPIKPQIGDSAYFILTHDVKGERNRFYIIKYTGDDVAFHDTTGHSGHIIYDACVQNEMLYVLQDDGIYKLSGNRLVLWIPLYGYTLICSDIHGRYLFGKTRNNEIYSISSSGSRVIYNVPVNMSVIKMYCKNRNIYAIALFYDENVTKTAIITINISNE